MFKKGEIIKTSDSNEYGVVDKFDYNNITYVWLDSDTKKWYTKPENDLDIERKIKALSWNTSNGERTLIYNIKVPIVNKNVDLCLFNCNHIDYKKYKKHTDPNAYIALGELKGGIDPAGADEHWKTANTALDRIRISFSKEALNPNTFFIGAAIQKYMAEEIWNDLSTGKLTNACNLNVDSQLKSICEWIINL